LDSTFAGPPSADNSPKLGQLLLLFCFLSLVIIGVQWYSGSYQSELSHWPDASAHVVNSMLIHDYLLKGIGQNPLRFAEQYHIHYPKVAIGAWPPLYYVIAALWMLVFGVNKTALLVLVALTAGAMATLIGALIWRWWHPLAGILTACFWVFLPQIIFGSTIFILDIAVALAQFLALLALVRFWEKRTIAAAAQFGFLAAAAIYTKGNATALALFAPLAILLSSNWWVLRHARIYLSALIVLLFALPWQLFYLTIFQGNALITRIDHYFIWGRASGYLEILIREMGWPLLSLAFTALSAILWRSFRALDVPVFLKALTALAIASFVFHCVVPIPGPDERYMTTVYSCLTGLAAAGLRL
jgi:hypothetical protein